MCWLCVAGSTTSKKPRSRGIFASFLCCFAPSSNNNNSSSSSAVTTASSNANTVSNTVPEENGVVNKVNVNQCLPLCMMLTLGFSPNNKMFYLMIILQGLFTMRLLLFLAGITEGNACALLLSRLSLQSYFKGQLPSFFLTLLRTW